MVALFKAQRNFIPCNCDAHWNSVCNPLGHCNYVRLYAAMPECKKLSGSAASCLDFVKYQQQVMPVAEFSQVFQIIFAWHYYTGFPLYRLDYDCCGFIVDCVFYRFCIIIFNMVKSFQHRLERLLYFVLSCCSQASECPAVEAVFCRYYPGFFGMLPCKFYCCLYAFCPVV